MLRPPRVGEVWETLTGSQALRIVDTGDNTHVARRRVITLQPLTGGALRTMRLRTLVKSWRLFQPLALPEPRRSPRSTCTCGTCALCVARACGW